MTTPRSLLALAVDIRQWLDADTAKPRDERLTRDRAIGERISSQRDYERVLAWWNALEPASPETGDKLVLLSRIVNGILLLLGLVLGASVASVALGYQGDYPVNLFALLGVLVGLPLIMLLVSLLMLAGGMPQALRDAFNVLSPGRWAGGWLERQLSVQMFESVSSRGISVRFARWQLMAFSQLFAIGYFAGVLIISSLLVVFTDLAFGWSSTIDLSADSVRQLVALLSVPWQWVPAAVPDPDLVDASRFFRLEGQLIEPDRASQLGRWWPFVLLCIVTYGLMPRLIMAAIAGWRLRAATVALLETGPEIRALLDRLASPVVEFDTEVQPGEKAPGSIVPSLHHLSPRPDDVVISWNAVLDQAQLVRVLDRWHVPHQNGFMMAEWDPPHARAATLASLPTPIPRIIVLTKGWDPPLLAFNDLVSTLQAQPGLFSSGHSSSLSSRLIVVPLDTSRQAVATTDANTWNVALASTGAEVAGTCP